VAEGEPERLLLALEDAVLVVEAVEVVGDANRVLRDSLRAALLCRIGDDCRQFREPLDQLALLRCERAVEIGGDLRIARVADDSRDARVRVLDVVDRILL
jgi:hypothetical protein